MTSPLGKKLRAAGYKSIWDYADPRGFTDLGTFLRDVNFESLAPIGFEDFVLACSELDRKLDKGFRIMAAYELNRARQRFRERSPSPGWIVISPVSSLATAFKDEVPWADRLTFMMRDYLLAHREVFDQPFSWNDDWLVEMVPSDGDNQPLCANPTLVIADFTASISTHSAKGRSWRYEWSIKRL